MTTIAAIATAPGRSAIAMIRVSGPDVGGVIDRCLDQKLPEREPSLRWLVHPETGDRVDQVLATYLPAPRSYTGEEMLELSCHGGALAPQLVLDAIHAAGAQPAEPGEFTRRAYLNGKLDLIQAEAILDLVDARSSVGYRAALHQLDRGLSRRIEELREAVIRCEGLLVYEIDFPEEDEGPVSGEQIDEAARDVGQLIDLLLETAADGELIREGALTVIAGRPNAGKSSLFNSICGAERVIVTDEPGTTRDAVEAVVSLGGFPFRLVDTAGLREADGKVERIGIEVARRYLEAADIVLFCAEAGRPLSEEELKFLDDVNAGVVILVRTKLDLVSGQETEAAPEGVAEGISVSADTGDGMGELRDRLIHGAFSGALAREAETPLVTRQRHARDLRRARAEIEEFLEARASRFAPEVAATHLRTAARALEELLGVIEPDDLLAHVFSQFCIGK